MTEQRRTTDSLSRRTALAGVATVGVGVPFLAACGADEETASDPAASSSAAGPSEDAASSAAPGETAAAPSGLASTADIEVGGGEVFADEEVVIVQPSEGEFKGYSAVCPHQGCLVGSVTSEGIVCPCHNSVFSLDDGAPTSGPADSPLDEVTLTVTGDQISLG